LSDLTAVGVVSRRDRDSLGAQGQPAGGDGTRPSKKFPRAIYRGKIFASPAPKVLQPPLCDIAISVSFPSASLSSQDIRKLSPVTGFVVALALCESFSTSRTIEERLSTVFLALPPRLALDRSPLFNTTKLAGLPLSPKSLIRPLLGTAFPVFCGTTTRPP
jgi:hypothetical protein